MATLEQLRSIFGGDSDEAVLRNAATNLNLPVSSLADEVGFDTGGKWGNRLSASVDSYQAGLLGVGEAVTGSDWFRRRREDNEAAAEVSRGFARDQGAVMSYKDANSLGDYADWAGGLVVDSLPYLGEALVGGIAGRALLTGGRLGLSRAAAGQVGTTMASYPSAVGDILQNQRDENGTTDLGSAAAGGVPYALANGLFGIEGAIGRGSLARSGIAALDDLTGVRGALARTGATAGRVALSEGASETAQEGVNQYFGRMAVNPDETLFNPEANDRYLESFVGGATLGGLVGGGAGGWRRSEGYTPSAVDDPAKPTNLLGGTPPNLLGGTPPNLVTDMGALPPLQDRINQNLGLNLKGAPKGYVKDVTQAYDEPSGVRLPDPETGVERELTVGEALARQAEMYQAEIQGRYFTPATGTEISSLPGGAVDPLAGNLGGTLYNPQGGLTPAPAAPSLTPEQQAAVQAAQEVEARVEAERAEAARFGITKDSQVRLLADVKDALGDSDPVEYGRLAGLIKAGRYGDVKQELKNAAVVAEQKKITQEANAAETEAITKAVQSNSAPQPPGLQIDLGADTGVPLEAGAIDAQTQDSVGRGQLAFNRWQELATEAARYNLTLPTEWGDLREDQKALVAEIAATKEALTFADVALVQNLPETPAKATGLKPPAAAPVANQDLEAAPTEQATTGVGQPGSSVKQQAVAEEQTTTDTASQQALGLQRQATAPTAPFVPAVEEQAAAPAATVEPTAPATEDQPATPAADTSPAAAQPAAQPAPAVGLQRQATAPTTPFVPAVEEQAAAPAAPATEDQSTAPAVGTSPAADAWQQVVAQAQALGTPVPTYGELRVGQQKQVEDLVRREQFNLAAADTVLAAPETKKPQPSAAGVNVRLPEKQGGDDVQTDTSTDTASLGRPGGGQAAVQGDGAVPGQAGAGGGIQRASSGGEQARGEDGVEGGAAVDGRGLKSQVRVRGEGEPSRTAGGYGPGVGPRVESVLGAESKNRPDVAPPADGKAVLERMKVLSQLRPTDSNRPKDPKAAEVYDRRMGEFTAAIPAREELESALLAAFTSTRSQQVRDRLKKATGYDFTIDSDGTARLLQVNNAAPITQIAEEELFPGGVEGRRLSAAEKKKIDSTKASISKQLTGLGFYQEVISRLGAAPDLKTYSDAELGVNSSEEAAQVGLSVFNNAAEVSGNVSLSEKYPERVQRTVDAELESLKAADFSEDAIKAAYAKLGGLAYKSTDKAAAGEVVQDAEGEFADAVGLDATEQTTDDAAVDPDTADGARDSKYNPYTAALAEALADQLLVKRKQRTRVDTGDVKLTQAEIEQRKFDSVKAAAQSVRAAVGSMGFSEAVSDWNDLRSDGAPEFDNLPVVRQAAWVSAYKSFFEDKNRGHITEDQFRSAVESEQRSFEAGAVFDQEAELERRVLARRLGANRPDGAGPAGSGVVAPQIDPNADVGTRAKAKLKSVQQNVAKADLTDEELEWAAQTFERLKNTAKAKEARAEQQKRATAAPAAEQNQAAATPADQALAVEQAPATAVAPVTTPANDAAASVMPDKATARREADLLIHAIAEVVRNNAQVKFTKQKGGTKYDLEIVGLASLNGENLSIGSVDVLPRSATEALVGASKRYMELLQAAGIEMPTDPKDMTRDQFVASMSLTGRIQSSEVLGRPGEKGSGVTIAPNGTFRTNFDDLYDRIERERNANLANVLQALTDGLDTTDAETSKSKSPFPDSAVQVPVYHATQADFDPADMRSGDIGIHFGDMWQAADRGGLAPERRIFGDLSPEQQNDPAVVGGELEGLLESDAVDAVEGRQQLGKRRMLKFFVNLKNPLAMSEPKGGAWHHPGELLAALRQAAITIPKNLDNLVSGFVQSTNTIRSGISMPQRQRQVLDAIKAHLRSLGFDGITYENQHEGKVVSQLYGSDVVKLDTTSYIVFDREQISQPIYDIRYSRGARKALDGGFGEPVRGTAPGETKVGYIHTTTDKQAFMDAYPGAAAAVRGLEALGLRHIWDRVAAIHVTDENTLQADGALAQAPDGSIQLWIDRDYLTAQDALRDLVSHELGGHLVDGGYGSAVKGKISGGIKWQVQLKNGKVTPVGAVARELHRLFSSMPAWERVLAYPFTDNKGMDANRVSEELFAQAAKLYIGNPEAVASRAPLTAAALQEAFKREAITKSESSAKHKSRPAARPKGTAVPQDSVGGNQENSDGLGSGGARVSRRNQKGASKTSYLSKAPSELADLASGIATSVKDWTFTRGAFTRDLLDAAAKLMPSASKYLDRMQRARVESVKLEREVAAILDDAAALSATERGTGEGSVNSLIRDMTYDGKWAFKPDWLRGVTPDPVLEARFNQLSDKAQDVVMRVFRHGYETLKQVQQAATDSIKSEVEPLIAKARAEGGMKTVKELERAKVNADGKFRRLMEIRGGMPYAPLRRFGNWAVVVKSKMYQDAQARGDKGEMDRLASDGNHYRVEFVPNRLVAAGRAKRLREVVGDSSVEFFERSDENLIYGGDSMFSAFSRFRKLAREKMEGEESKVVTALDKTLASMYMALVAETSARTSEFDRKNVAGADKDMLRSFATHGRAMANFIGSLKTSGDVMDILRVMKREAGEGGSRAEKSTLYNEILRRHAMGLNYEPNQLLDKSLAANSYWSLVTSPSYLLTNLTQPWVVSLPVLAGRFGTGRSSSEMFRAYKEIGRIASRLVDNPDAVKDLPKDVQGAVEELFNRGSIDISLGADLGAFTSGGDSKLSANMEKAIRFPRTLVERGEMVNRVATAVAAYRLAKSQGMKDEAAINYADKVIYETHGDYSAFNSPRVMRNAVGRFATQFRKFQLIQIALYGRMIRDSLKGATPEERAIARRSLAYMLGTTFALGGLTAMPGFTAISFLMGAFGDDDEPDDPEATLRRALGGGAEADLLMRGVPNLLGMNIGNRIGAAGMLSILPYTDLEASREGYKDILMGVAGPFFGGTLPKALDGLGLIRQGDLWKGLEMLAPRGLADVSKGIRFGTEGVTKRNGDVVLSGDDVSFFAVVAQAMGLPTTTITDNQMLRNSQFTADEFYKDRTGQLKRQYVQAYRSGDGAKLREIRAEWQETQQARRRLGFKVQPLSTLLKSPQEQRKREAKPLNTELVE